MSITIRLANENDFDKLAYLRWCFDNEGHEADDSNGRASFIRAFLERQGDANLFHWLAEVDGVIVANMSVRRVKKVPRVGELDGHWGYLTNSYTLPDYRNRQIGSRLLAAVTAWARNEQFELLVVWPSDRSFAFYERGGFERRPDPLVLQLKPERGSKAGKAGARGKSCC